MTEISVQEIKKRLDAGEKLHIIDVREPEEYTAYNIGATLLPLGKVMSMEIDAIDHLKNEELLVHCRSGKRSLQACLFLETLGFTNVKNVEGGILAWQSMEHLQ